MKKVVALLVAALMLVTLTVSAFAAENTPSAELADVTAETAGVVVSESTDDTAATAVDAALASDETVEYLFELTVPAGTTSVVLNVTLNGEFEKVLHWNGTAWDESITGTYANGVLTLTGSSWSPIAIVVKTASTAAGGANGEGTGATAGGGAAAAGTAAAAATVSPQTGEVATSVYVAFAAVMVVAAAAFVVKSKKAA